MFLRSVWDCFEHLEVQAIRLLSTEISEARRKPYEFGLLGTFSKNWGAVVALAKLKHRKRPFDLCRCTCGCWCLWPSARCCNLPQVGYLSKTLNRLTVDLHCMDQRMQKHDGRTSNLEALVSGLFDTRNYEDGIQHLHTIADKQNYTHVVDGLAFTNFITSLSCSLKMPGQGDVVPTNHPQFQSKKFPRQRRFMKIWQGQYTPTN